MSIACLCGKNATFIKEKNPQVIIMVTIYWALYRHQLIFSPKGMRLFNELDVILYTLQKRKDVTKG